MRGRQTYTRPMVRELYRIICVANHVKSPPRLRLVTRLPGNHHGESMAGSGTISVSMSRHQGKPISVLLDTLLHELAHDLVPDGDPHGDEWQQVATYLGALPTLGGLRGTSVFTGAADMRFG